MRSFTMHLRACRDKQCGGSCREDGRMAENVSSLSDDRIAYLEGLVRRGKTAAAVFTQFSQQDVDAIVKAMVLAGLDQAQYLARLAIEETKLGVLEDKAIKNIDRKSTRLN